MTFINDKHMYPSLSSASDFLNSYKPQYGGKIPNAALLIYDRKVLNTIKKMYKTRKIKLFYESYIAQDILIISGFGIGAPAVCTLIELLIELGISEIHTLGLAGGICADPGTILQVSSAIADDGVSEHYLGNVKIVNGRSDVDCDSGLVWSTSAIFRETKKEIDKMREMNVKAVDMESAGVLAVCEYYNIYCRIILIISDKFGPEGWNLNYRPEKSTIIKAIELILS